MTQPNPLPILTVAGTLPPAAAAELDERGFVILPAVVSRDRLAALSAAYDEAVASATGDDIRVGSTTTRVSDLVNRGGAAFDDLYIFPPLIEAAVRVIEGPFKLSSLMARTLRPHQPAQELHVDVQPDSADCPLLGFILMVDDFRSDNGATRFVPGSHRKSDGQGDAVLALGAAGSLVIFNASTWHGHSENTTAAPRRSIQGYFVPRAGRAGTDFAARMTPETRARLCPLALYLLSLEGAPG
jgi:ectoine hydroxylase-related dioxygenase (phytanoyl-CoA dioxygenase family)